MKYYKQIYGSKFENLDKVCISRKNRKVPKLSQEESENLNRPITI